MMRYYAIGILVDAPHPFHKTRLHKHNPLQRLVYLSLWVIINPAIWISGLLYFFYNDWPEWGLAEHLNIENVSIVHAIAAYFIVTFLIIHVYLITTGHTLTAYLKAMITGWTEIEEEDKTQTAEKG